MRHALLVTNFHEFSKLNSLLVNIAEKKGRYWVIRTILQIFLLAEPNIFFDQLFVKTIANTIVQNLVDKS